MSGFGACQPEGVPGDVLTRKERRDAARRERVEAERAAAAAQQRRRRLTILGGVLGACVIAVVVAIVASSGGGGSATVKRLPGERVAGQQAAAAMFAGIPQHGTVLGNPNAKVTVLEFADLKCPICRNYTLDVMPAIVRDYVRTGKVKVDLQLMTFIGPDSVGAAQFAHGAAQQRLMWNVADVFYANQGDERRQYVDQAFLRRIGSGVPGLNVDRALAQTSTAELTATQQLVDRYRVTGTPTFVVDGRKLAGFDAATLTSALDAALAK